MQLQEETVEDLSSQSYKDLFSFIWKLLFVEIFMWFYFMLYII